MPRPEGFASAQFHVVESTGRQIMVECIHCHNKRLARSVAARKVKHLQVCFEFQTFLDQMIARGDMTELSYVPAELMGRRVDGRIEVQDPSSRNLGSASVAHLLEGLNAEMGNQGGRPAPVGGETSTSRPDLSGFEDSMGETRDVSDDGDGDADTNMEGTPSHPQPQPQPQSQPQSQPPSQPQPNPHPHVAQLRALHRPAFQEPLIPDRAVAFAHRAAQRRKDKLDAVITRAIYEGSLPFNVFDSLKHPALTEFFRLVDYAPPSRQKVADNVYDRSYDQAEHTVVNGSGPSLAGTVANNTPLSNIRSIVHNTPHSITHNTPHSITNNTPHSITNNTPHSIANSTPHSNVQSTAHYPP